MSPSGAGWAGEELGGPLPEPLPLPSSPWALPALPGCPCLTTPVWPPAPALPHLAAPAWLSPPGLGTEHHVPDDQRVPSPSHG